MITEYINGIQYNGNTIDFIQTEEGRATNSAGNYKYEYTLTDYLGNNRVSFDETSGKVQEMDYYPFGLNVNRQTYFANKYLYNKKELQEELTQYDYGARFYDPVIARWITVDPLAEKTRRFSPYVYGDDNSIRNIDPDGMQSQDCCDALKMLKKYYNFLVTDAISLTSKYTVKTEFKTSVGIQAGIEIAHIGEVKFAPFAVVASKDNTVFRNGKKAEQTGTLFNMDTDKKTGKNTNNKSIEVESKFGVEAVKSGGEVGQSFRGSGSEAQMVPGSNSSYAKASFFGFETKTTENSNGSKTQSKSFEMSWGGQFVFGFEFTIRIERKDK